jgi:hypothetical protein
MGYEDLANVNRVIEFIHEYKNCGLKESGRLNDLNIGEAISYLEEIRQEIIDNI